MFHGKKIERRKKKANLKLINYFYIFLKFYFTFFYSVVNNLKIYKFITNFKLYLIFFLIFYNKLNVKNLFFLTLFLLFHTFQGTKQGLRVFIFNLSDFLYDILTLGFL